MRRVGGFQAGRYNCFKDHIKKLASEPKRAQKFKAGFRGQLQKKIMFLLFIAILGPLLHFSGRQSMLKLTGILTNVKKN